MESATTNSFGCWTELAPLLHGIGLALEHRVLSFINRLPYWMVQICFPWPCMNTYMYNTLYYMF